MALRTLPSGETQIDVLGPMRVTVIGERTLCLASGDVTMVVAGRDLVPALLAALAERDQEPQLRYPLDGDEDGADRGRWIRWHRRQRAYHALSDTLDEVLPPMQPHHPAAP